MLRTVEIRYYAQLREALKTSRESIEMELPLCEKDILDLLVERHPKQRELLYASRVAVNEGYVDEEARLQDFSEIDIISPVSGG